MRLTLLGYGDLPLESPCPFEAKPAGAGSLTAATWLVEERYVFRPATMFGQLDDGAGYGPV